MSVLASKVIEVAEGEVGYLEKASNSELDNKTANVGTNNYTKYGRDLVKLVGSPYANGVAWCDMFVDWCFITAYGKQKAFELLNGWSAYTPTSAEYFKNIGGWIDKSQKPKAGDIIFFKNSERICHVGLVYKVDATNIYTIEGNTSSGSNTVIPNGGGVFKKLYRIGHERIAGFGRPKYDAEPNAVIPRKSNYHYGIDISSCQGDINFSEVKASGVEFAILRVTTKNNQIDPCFERYLRSCKVYDITTNCYKYSYARTAEEAINEANKVLEVLATRRMPIWYDLENNEQLQAIGKAGIERVATMFLETCKRNNYPVGIYCSLDWYKNHISDELKKKYKFWIARYSINNGMLNEAYKPNVGEIGWQFTSRMRINGIKGDVDGDVMLDHNWR